MMRLRISTNNPVRRRLFPEDEVSKVAKTDNFINAFNEELARDREEKKLKWNFDFFKEEPLPGDYEWTRCDATNEFIGRSTKKRPSIEIEDNAETSNINTDVVRELTENYPIDGTTMQKINETTPDKLKVKSNEESAPLMPKRRKKESDSQSCHKARRSIDFE